MNCWFYVPRDLNPADIITKNYTFDKLSKMSLWWNGPSFITETCENWPTWRLSDNNVPLDSIDVTSCNISSNDICLKFALCNIINIKRYSSLKKLLNVTVYVLRAFQKNANSGAITADEIYRAKLCWIKCVQSIEYAREIDRLDRKIPRSTNLIRQLNLDIDKKTKILYCKGRLHNAPIELQSKFPTLLPPRHYFTDLVVLDAHKSVCHFGVDATIVKIRSQFWIPKLRQIVKYLLYKCVVCKRVNGKHFPNPISPPLQADRLKDCAPFTIIGLDFTGAILVLNENLNSFSKAYILLFTCTTSRNVWLELVQDMSVNNFILAFRRFSSTCGFPNIIWSDNASTFECADLLIRKLCRAKEVLSFFSEVNCTWKFQPKRMPWHGGFFERLIGLTKSLLRKVLGNSKLTFIQLQTLLCEITLVLNQRPLTYVSSDFNDDVSLTPNMLRFGRNFNILPYPIVDLDELNDPDFNNHDQLLKFAKTRAYLCDQFSTRWKNEYLLALRQRQTSNGSRINHVKKGNIVLIHAANLPRLRWKLGLIVQLNTGKDGIVRSVILKTQNGYTSRPIVKLYPLEVSCDNSDALSIPDFNSNQATNLTQDPNLNVNNRPQRQSKINANEKIKTYFEDSESESD